MLDRLARPRAATWLAVALLAALATGGCGGVAATPAPLATVPVGAAAPPAPTSAGNSPGPATAPTGTPAAGAAERAAQLAVAATVLRAIGQVAAGRPFPAGLRPEVHEDILRLIDGSDGVGRRCLVEFTVTNTPTWQFAPAYFVPLLNHDGTAAGTARDEGARLTATRLEGYRTAVTFQAPPPGTGATPVALPTGSPCAPATPGVAVQFPDHDHRALRGHAIAVLVEWRDGTWVATGVESTGTGLP